MHMYNSFYGWYLKCQSGTQTLAVIPAIHNTGNKCTCSIQVITDNNAWESNPGRSFPKAYIWTQCFSTDGTLMLSVAGIPMAGIRFTGIIGVILWRGKEYRIATYLGARVVKIQDKMVWVKQGSLELDVRLLETS